MTKIEDLIDELGTTSHGKVFLINLYHTIEKNFVHPSQVKAVFNTFIHKLAIGRYAIPPAIDLPNLLGNACVGEGLWQTGPEPILQHHLFRRQSVLTRVTTYSGFFYSIIKRTGSPPLPNLPEPLELVHSNSEEIDPVNVNKVQDTINSGKWKDLITGMVRFATQCVWLAPLPRIKKKLSSVTIHDIADSHRDLIGLSHFGKGRHLIRLDIDLGKWIDGMSKLRRRPHGACNGGNRFRLIYDGRECKCQWGRTVDLAMVATGPSRSLNGIPELLMEGFFVPKTAIEATYLGSVIHQPENNDSYFINRLRRKLRFSTIKDKLKSTLS